MGKAATAQPVSRLRKARNILLVTLITLCLFEITLRVNEALQDIPVQEQLHIFQPNPTGSMRLQPNLNVPVTVEGRPFTIQTNSQGLAWRETALAKDTNRSRIAFIGDSFTQGMWSASPDSSFVGIAEQELGRAECINFGVGGYGLGDMRLILEEEVFQYSPDQVVLVFFCGNDYSGTYDGLIEEADVTPAWTFSSFVYRHLALARFAASLINTVHHAPSTAESLFQDQPDFDSAGELEWIHTAYDDRQAAAVDTSIAEMARIRSLCMAHDAQLSVVALPFERQVYIQAGSGPDWRLDQPQLPVEAWCAAQEVPYLDLLPPLRKEARAQPAPLYFKQEQHLTPTGHLAVGKRIGAWLNEMQMPASPPSDSIGTNP